MKDKAWELASRIYRCSLMTFRGHGLWNKLQEWLYSLSNCLYHSQAKLCRFTGGHEVDMRDRNCSS